MGVVIGLNRGRRHNPGNKLIEPLKKDTFVPVYDVSSLGGQPCACNFIPRTPTAKLLCDRAVQ